MMKLITVAVFNYIMCTAICKCLQYNINGKHSEIRRGPMETMSKQVQRFRTNVRPVQDNSIFGDSSDDDSPNHKQKQSTNNNVMTFDGRQEQGIAGFGGVQREEPAVIDSVLERVESQILFNINIEAGLDK